MTAATIAAIQEALASARINDDQPAVRALTRMLDQLEG